MGKVANLCRRKGSSSYYFRCRIPVDLLEHYAPKKEVIRSLRTPERIEALSRVKIEALKQDQEFAEARRRLAQEPKHELSDVEIERLAAIWLHDVLEEDEEIRLAGLDEKSYRQIEESLDICEAGERPKLARGDTNLVEFEVDDLLDCNGIKLDKDSESYIRLSYAILKARVKSTELIKLRHQGEVVDTPPSSSAPIQSSFSSEQKTNGLLLSVLFDKWKEERKPPEKTASDFGAQIRRFIELHGDIPVTSLNKAHVREQGFHAMGAMH